MATTLPPGPRYPGIVMLLVTQFRTQATLDWVGRRYGDIFTIRLLRGKTVVPVSDPKLVEQLFSAGQDVLFDFGHGAFLLGEHSVMVVRGSAHGAARELLRPHLDQDRLPRYRAGLEQVCAEEFASWPVNERFRMLPRLEEITLNSVISAVFGITGGADREALLTRFDDMQTFRRRHPITVVKISVSPTGAKPPEKFMRVRRAFDDEIRKHIERARQDPRLAARDDALAAFVQARRGDGSPLTDDEVRDHVVTLMIQGHGSPASTLAMAIQRLVRNPESLERLRDECRTPNGDGEYLDCVIKETLRLHPPVPSMVREVAKPFRIGGYELPPKTLVSANAYSLHRREDLYPEPLRFRPERWLGRQPGTYTWIPFGGGYRYCVGRSFGEFEMKLALGMMMREFDFEPTPDAPEIKTSRRGISWIPKGGAPVVIRARELAAVGARASDRP